jgi:hypothetical protein
MRLIFTCPEKNKVFESEDFEIIDNRGVTTDNQGNRILDARVALKNPCPLCGQEHVFHVSELACPFTG